MRLVQSWLDLIRYSGSAPIFWRLVTSAFYLFTKVSVGEMFYVKIHLSLGGWTSPTGAMPPSVHSLDHTLCTGGVTWPSNELTLWTTDPKCRRLNLISCLQAKSSSATMWLKTRAWIRLYLRDWSWVLFGFWSIVKIHRWSLNPSTSHWPPHYALS